MQANDQQVIHVRRLGNLGNLMFQFMTAQTIASQVPGAMIANVVIPEWNLHYEDVEAEPSDRITFGHAEEVASAGNVDPEAIVAALLRGGISRVNLSHYCQNVYNLLPNDAYTPFFPWDQSVIGAAEDELLINIRLGDIANGHHTDYVLLPVDFYASVVAVTGLKPVFLGQLDPGSYLDALKAAFPNARYIPTRGAMADFQFIRNSCNIIPAVSTFSWCATWLSRAKRVIFPVAGLYHPLQSRHTWLLPLDDPRYEFWLFPIYYSLPQDQALAYHPGLKDLWRLVPPEFLKRLKTAPTYKRRKKDFIEVFDPEFYLHHFSDVRIGVESGAIKSGLTHYVMNGFDENRPAFRLDPNTYFQRYAVAAMEVSQGDYMDAHHHYVAVGRLRGYQPTP